MKLVTKVQTSDGNLHDSAQLAEHHAEERYGNALTNLAQRAVRVEKYSAMMQFIEDNLEAFVALKALREDKTMESQDDEEDSCSGPGRVRRA